MEDWEVKHIKISKDLAELKAWLYGMTTLNSKVDVSYGLDKIKEVEHKLRVFTPEGLLEPMSTDNE